MNTFKTLREFTTTSIYFNFQHFEKLIYFSDKVKYCNSTLEKIGAGSSRIVYKLNDEHVLKLAKNTKGKVQNMVEADLSETKNYNCIIAEVLEFAEDHTWIVAEKCDKLTAAKFKQETDIKWKSYQDIMTYYYDCRNPNRFNPKDQPDLPDEDFENEFLYLMDDFLADYNLPVGDYVRLTSFGFSKEKGVVLVDYGLNNEVLRNYYTK